MDRRPHQPQQSQSEQTSFFDERNHSAQPGSSRGQLPPAPERFSHQPRHSWAPANALASLQAPSAPFPSLSTSLSYPPPNRLGQYALPTPSPAAQPRLSVVTFLEALDLTEYVTIFLNEGFDRMESLVDAQEDDFAAMGVKRGHRRVIQRELATMRGLPISAPLVVGGRDSAHGDEDDEDDEDEHVEGQDSVRQTNQSTIYLGGSSAPGGATGSRAGAPAVSEPSAKRRYRRHPKPDTSAPEKPPSAYVEFSNSVREELRGAGKSFTEIARLVGELWQGVDREEKERLEAAAAQAKMRYTTLMTEYKKTSEYAAYQSYLADFRRKYPLEPNASASHPSPGAGDSRRGGQAAQAPTPPTLYSRSSGEDSNAEAGTSNIERESGRRSRRASSLGPGGAEGEGVSLAAYRKRQRVESSVVAGGSVPPRFSPHASEWQPPSPDRRGPGAYDATPASPGVSRRTSGGRTNGQNSAPDQSERERASIRLSTASSSNHVGIATSDLRSSARPALPEVYSTGAEG